ncbi:MAG: hypothetical protein DRH26_04210 [Deltaproteobacteria bacterium]|nr:MAG: hypothetical protein DRH26_04210 [Deltaproteobacteria bacterium]
MDKEVTAAITAENQFTDWIRPKDAHYDDVENGHFLNISIAGTWSGTVTLQRRFSTSDTARDVEEFTGNAEESLFDHESTVEYRLGIKTGDYTSGTCNARLGA